MSENEDHYNIPIIIVNWNGYDDTVECIQSLKILNSNNYQIYLIDNNSDNQEGERLTSLYQGDKRISVYVNNENLGFAKAHIKIWDDLLCKMEAPFIVLLNNDTIVDSHWLGALSEAFHKSQADIIACKMINYYQRNIMDNAGHRMLNTGEIIPVGHGENIDFHNVSAQVLGACGGAVLYSSEMIKSIGFFDAYFSTGYEDAEFGLRATALGYKSIFVPDAIVYHKMGQSIKKVFNEDYSLMIHTAILYSYFKCMPFLNIVVAIPSFIFKYCSMLIIDIIFMRYKYLKILVKSWKKLLMNEGNWIQKRREISSSKLMYLRHPQLIFFLWFDMKRFWNFILLKKDSNLDAYGS